MWGCSNAPMSAPPSSRVARLGRFRKRQPLLTWASAFLVALLGLLPLVFLVDQASGLGWTRAVHVLWRPRVRMLLVNTIELSSAVTVGSAILGVAVAWCLERTHLPGRRVWAVLVVLPVTIPEFVGASGWVSIFPSLEGFPAAVLVMTLALYPLVYLPVAGALRGLDPALEETGRSLGLGTWGVFRRVILPQLRPAVLGGCLVVSLYLLAEYGSFALVRYALHRTFLMNWVRLVLVV